jgi:phenylalanyl-tRNA synthetase beta chain
MMNNSLVSSSHASLQEAKQTKEEHQVKLLNPLSLELDAMRQSLIYGALDVIAYNQNRQQANLKLLEFGKVYHKFESGYVENKRLILALTGKQDADHWNGTNQPSSFYQLKGILTAL